MQLEGSIERLDRRNGLILSVRVANTTSYKICSIDGNVFEINNETLTGSVKRRPVIVVADASVDRFIRKDVSSYFSKIDGVLKSYIVIDGGEQSKSLDIVEKIWSEANRVGLPRNGLMIAVGGGAIMDVVGFAASTFRRGVGYIRVPTTLVGMVDAGIGIKNAINWNRRKNVIGAFFAPEAAFVDIRFLRTTLALSISDGISEILKIALIRDAKLFALLEEHGPHLVQTRFQMPIEVAREIVQRSQELMLEELAGNLFEHDPRRLVNFGHFFSPTMEACSEFEISHGRAVSMDMAMSAFIAWRKGLLGDQDLDRIFRLMVATGLPVSQDTCSVDILADGLRQHCVTGEGTLNFVVPNGIGRGTFIDAVDADDIAAAMAYCSAAGACPQRKDSTQGGG